jgi:hypothetical protein
MESKLLLKIASLFLMLSVCLLGYTAMSAWAIPTPTPGKVAIGENVTIEESSTVRIYFTSGGDQYFGRLVISSDYIQIDNGTEIGVQSTVPCDLNLTTWAPVAEKHAGTVAEFTLYSAGVWVAFQFYVGNLKVGHWYNVLIDGKLGPKLLTASQAGVIGFAYAGNPGKHNFEIRQSALAPPMVNLLGVIVLMLVVGVVVGIVGETTYQLRKQKPVSTEHMVKSLINMTIYIAIAVGIIGAIYGLLANM